MILGSRPEPDVEKSSLWRLAVSDEELGTPIGGPDGLEREPVGSPLPRRRLGALKFLGVVTCVDTSEYGCVGGTLVTEVDDVEVWSPREFDTVACR
jgi:hypothetical protein